MLATPTALDMPLRTDADGVIRIGHTRVTLTTIIACHRRGDTPEHIHEGFPTVPLADIYAVIAYYLANQDEVDAYIRQEDEEAERWRQAYEADHPEASAFDKKVLTLLEEKRKKDQS
jgi:uncharacterized protein (DUF433 family)